MPHYATPEMIETLKAKAVALDDCDCSDLDESSYRRCKDTSPWQAGSIVWADVHGFDAPPVRVLVYRIEVEFSDYCFGYVNHAIGFVQTKGSTWGRMLRHIKRGEITRGYDKAEKLGLSI